MMNRKEYNREYYRKNKDAINEKRRQKRKQWTPEQIERERQIQKQWRDSHREQIREKAKSPEAKKRQKDWCDNNKNRISVHRKRYRTTHMDAVRESRRKTNAVYYAHTGPEESSGQRYASDEILMIMEKQLPDRQLADLLGRSVSAIQNFRSYKNRQGWTPDGKDA